MSWRAKVELQSQQQGLIAAENQQEKDFILLKREIGVDPEQEIDLTDPAPYSELAEQTPEGVQAVAYQNRQPGSLIVSIIVDAHGNPQNPRVVRPLGMGLDQKALEAVMKYKFKPAMKDGKTPVPVMVNVEINFRLY